MKCTIHFNHWALGSLVQPFLSSAMVPVELCKSRKNKHVNAKLQQKAFQENKQKTNFKQKFKFHYTLPCKTSTVCFLNSSTSFLKAHPCCMGRVVDLLRWSTLCLQEAIFVSFMNWMVKYFSQPF